MTAESPPEDLTDDALYADDIPLPGEPAGQDDGGDAPYGWTTDPKTGERRPKKRPGRPRKPPGEEELRAGAAPPDTEPDLPPGPRRQAAKPDEADVPMPRGGVIAKGVNRLYRRAGKIVRAMDWDIGTAIIECTRSEEPDDLTVGEAWEQLARTNPRVRAFLLKALKGGAWQDLVMAHAPIGIALAMKPAVQRMLPFGRLAESVLEPDEDSQPGDLLPADAAEMQAMAEQQAAKIAQRMGVKVPDHVVAQAAAQASRYAAGMGITPPYEEHDLSHPDGELPAGFRRQQPRNRSRAARKRG
jgi:hypothetical protein